MKFTELFPENGRVQRLYCDDCQTPMKLIFDSFKKKVESIQFNIDNFPFLHCIECKRNYLLDRSRFFLNKII